MRENERERLAEVQTGSEDIFDGKNIVTEHEKMFSDEGIKIKALVAKLK